MEVIRGYVYRLKPTAEQEILLARTAGVTRLVYNLALEQRQKFGGKPYKGGKSRNFGSKGLSGELSELRKAYDWIKAASQTAQNQALIDLDKAFANFFAGRAGYPTPRKRGRDDSFRHAGREVAVRRLGKRWSEAFIPKIGWIRYRDTRPLAEAADGKVNLRNATLRRRPDGHWEIAFALKVEIQIVDTPEAAVGADRGVVNACALSTGETIRLPATMAQREKTIRCACKRLSRQKRGSRRYAKTRRRIAQLKASNAACRSHTAHVLSRRMVRSFGLVALEDLKIRNMTASARGTVEEPGRNVAQKAGLNRVILNVGWYGLERMLAYKLEETGGVLVKVPAAYSSQTCACCGHVAKESRESQAVFRCVACNVTENADVNAARVILQRALAAETEGRRNASSLDVEGAFAPGEASTRCVTSQLDAVA